MNYVDLTRAASCIGDDISIKFENNSDGGFASSKQTTNATKTGFLCPICERHFTQKGKMIILHLKHSKIQQISDANEARVFGPNIRTGNLKTHLMTHSGERPFKCQYIGCDKTFTQRGNLDTHVKIHTDTKDHKCQYCDRGFTQKTNLRTHIRSVHTKEKPYSCGHCGKAFSQRYHQICTISCVF